ncbi:MAG: PAS domain S-box protein [Methanomicrobiales archaeon]|nr:PAS domain S-box protein [Methanomicrobiales archaeon]
MYRVLYVDDEPGILELVQMYLESFGNMLVDICPSADDAGELVEKTAYDAIVLDYYMPDVNGIEFLKIVRQNGLECPIIIYTGRGREDVVIDALNNGADFYLQKAGEPTQEFADLYSKVTQAVHKFNAEKRVKETSALLRSTLESTADGILVVNVDGKVSAWNRKFVQMWNIPYHIIEEGNYSQILSYLLPQISNRDQFFQHNDWQPRESIRPGIDIITLRDGKIFERYSQPQMIDGVLVGKVWSYRDITIKNSFETALRESEERFRLLFEQGPVPYQSLDEHGNIIEVNEAWTRLMGYKKIDVSSRPFFEYIPSNWKKVFFDYLEYLNITGNVGLSEMEVIHQTGKSIPILITGNILKGVSGMKFRTLWTFSDISELKLIESQKNEALSQIQKNLAELAILNDGIRNPLTVIAGHAELILGDQADLILKQVKIIDKMVSQLDQRWHESGKILNFLRRHHDIHMTDHDSSEKSKII